jgi:hypothetical protein
VYEFFKLKKITFIFILIYIGFEIALHNFTLRHPKLYNYIYANVNANYIHILEMYIYLIYTYPTRK